MSSGIIRTLPFNSAMYLGENMRGEMGFISEGGSVFFLSLRCPEDFREISFKHYLEVHHPLAGILNSHGSLTFSFNHEEDGNYFFEVNPITSGRNIPNEVEYGLLNQRLVKGYLWDKMFEMFSDGNDLVNHQGLTITRRGMIFKS